MILKNEFGRNIFAAAVCAGLLAWGGLSAAACLAKAGQRIPVTERGKLVAYLVPADEPTSMYQRLVAAGQVKPATGRGILDLMPPPPAPPGSRPMSEVLQEMRDEERY